MRLDFSGQVVLVTGASRGIGEQMAREVIPPSRLAPTLRGVAGAADRG